ncbi:cilia- and flagella-associated protein 299 [Stigmatopora nigra]
MVTRLHTRKMESNKCDNAVKPFKNYEEYLDSKVTPIELCFLRSKESARKPVGTRTQGHCAESAGIPTAENSIGLGHRLPPEPDSSLIFIRDVNALGQEVSGYMDYAHKLQTHDFAPYFSGRKKLLPGPLDLCYYNWSTQVSASTSSVNYEILYQHNGGLLFKRKMDGDILNVDPQCHPGQNAMKNVVESAIYTHVVILDHHITSS